ncbi:50S ribosomal protein L9, putative [Babesia ovata]|uniref:50S ribosomal protein L9, putative n=1 Tax=Babesia ovata TaxID=189622 RepID=A0A2H6KEL9_9APIC|nr:50S ribosomal protein L9, putative [Babesia ovata]GBE61436.1 50S ribosomal protein L9, putative [Babesia ovata]
MIPQGRATYANWQNIDMFANARHDASANSETENGVHEDVSTDTDWMANLVVTVEVNTLSKDRKSACAPLSLYRILDILSRRHQIDLLPSQLVGVVRQHEAQMCDETNRIPTTGEYHIAARLPLASLRANAVAFTLKLVHLDGQ